MGSSTGSGHGPWSTTPATRVSGRSRTSPTRRRATSSRRWSWRPCDWHDWPCRTCAPPGGGRVVNVSSIYGLTTTPFSGWYQASKHALEAASDALRIEVARDGVRVVLIEPGGVKTAIWAQMEADVARRAGSRFEAQYRRVLGLLAPYSALMARPDAVAEVIGSALTARSPRARYLVGLDAPGIVAVQSLVPTALRDRVVRLLTGL